MADVSFNGLNHFVLDMLDQSASRVKVVQELVERMEAALTMSNEIDWDEEELVYRLTTAFIGVALAPREQFAQVRAMLGEMRADIEESFPGMPHTRFVILSLIQEAVELVH